MYEALCLVAVSGTTDRGNSQGSRDASSIATENEVDDALHIRTVELVNAGELFP